MLKQTAAAAIACALITGPFHAITTDPGKGEHGARGPGHAETTSPGLNEGRLADHPETGAEALFEVIRGGHMANLASLLDSGADISVRDEDGEVAPPSRPDGRGLHLVANRRL